MEDNDITSTDDLKVDNYGENKIATAGGANSRLTPNRSKQASAELIKNVNSESGLPTGGVMSPNSITEESKSHMQEDSISPPITKETEPDDVRGSNVTGEFAGFQETSSPCDRRTRINTKLGAITVTRMDTAVVSSPTDTTPNHTSG